LLSIRTRDASCKTDRLSLPVVLREESFALNAKIRAETVMNMFEYLLGLKGLVLEIELQREERCFEVYFCTL